MSSVFIFVTAFSAQAQKSDAKDWSIADYFKNLPKKYITAEDDGYAQPSAETLVVDEKNGYAAQMESSRRLTVEPFPVFEMALFKSQTKSPLVVVTHRTIATPCSDYEIFFLRRTGNRWTEVKQAVLPPLDLKIFWSSGGTQSAGKLLKIVKQGQIVYQFEPPRVGRSMKVSMAICDFSQDGASQAKVDEFSKLIESAKPVYFEWDKQTGKFKFAK
ncbi:MAG: hypothetical protein LH614_01615 [Pyrinomonadaceae bacterium]|nr:hypothetical protein [Pyrinomonadaceae bacterium]